MAVDPAPKQGDLARLRGRAEAAFILSLKAGCDGRDNQTVGLDRSSSECVELSSASLRTSARLAGFSAGCDRLVHPQVTEAGERGRQRRLIGVLLAAPFAIGAAGVQVLAGQYGIAALLAAVCALFGASWMGALAIASTRRATALGAAMLALGAAAAGLLIAAAGGPASPLALLALALVIEPYWVEPSRRSAAAGGAAAAAALAVSAAAGSFLPSPEAVSAPAALWLVPLCYMATVWMRFAGPADDAKERAGLATEALLEAVVLRMSAAGEVQEASPQARRIMGLQPEFLVGTGLFDRIHVADRLAWMTALADLREGAGFRRVELRLRLPAENGRPEAGYQPFAAELSGAGEGSDMVLAVIRDDSAAADLRASLARAEERAESDDLAKGRFLASVSHELRTPLNAIIGFSDMLLHEAYGGFTDARQKEYAGLIRESGNHLLSVVNSILDVSKIESGAYAIHPEPFRFAEAAEMCRSMLAQQAEAKSIRLDDRVTADAGEIRGDRRAIQQVLINLVSNAVKFTPEGGEVAIGAQRLGSRLVFWVGDNGIGIAEEDLARLGEPFVQVQNDYTRRYDGTGLGLSLVKGLVALHEGTMSIESAPGQGTTVTVTLPCEGPAGADAPGKLLALAAKKNKMEAKDDGFRKTA